MTIRIVAGMAALALLVCACGDTGESVLPSTPEAPVEVESRAPASPQPTATTAPSTAPLATASPSPTATPRPTREPLSPTALAALAARAKLPDEVAATCVATGTTINGNDLGKRPTMRCTDGAVTVEIADIAAAKDRWNQWDDAFGADLEACSGKVRSLAVFAVGGALGGILGGCEGGTWLGWIGYGPSILGRVEHTTGTMADLLAWFADVRPFEPQQGRLRTAWLEDGRALLLPRMTAREARVLASEPGYANVKRLATSEGSGGGNVPRLVRLTGRAALCDMDVGFVTYQAGRGADTGLVVVGRYDCTSDRSWRQLQSEGVIELLGWVSGTIGTKRFAAIPAAAVPVPRKLPSALPYLIPLGSP